MNEPSNPQPTSWSPQPPRPSVAVGGGGPRPPQPTFGGTNSTLGTGEGEVPLAKPPASSVSVRTMASDLASLQSTGGTQPRPYAPSPAGGAGATPRPMSPPNVPPASPMPPSAPRPFNAPSTAPQPPVPPPTGRPGVPNMPQTPQRGPAPAKSSKGFLVGTIIVVAVIGLGALGYFVVYPLIAEPAVSEPPPPAPPEPAPVPEPPALIITEPTSTPATPTSTPSDALPTPLHTSLFRAPADLTEELILVSSDLTSFRSQIPFDTAEVSILREINVALPSAPSQPLLGTGGVNTDPITLEQLLPFVAPGLFDRDTMRAFGNDVTVFTYTDSKGTWPGFAVRATNNVPLAAVQMKVNQTLEQAVALKQFFLTNPGTAGAWKSGSTGNVQNRYQTFSLPGAALNYAWTDRTLVVATSYDTFQTALGRIK